MAETKTPQKNTANIRKQVISVIREVLSDPERGLDLSQEAEERLLKSLQSKKEGKTKNLKEVIDNYS